MGATSGTGRYGVSLIDRRLLRTVATSRTTSQRPRLSMKVIAPGGASGLQIRERPRAGLWWVRLPTLSADIAERQMTLYAKGFIHSSGGRPRPSSLETWRLRDGGSTRKTIKRIAVAVDEGVPRAGTCWRRGISASISSSPVGHRRYAMLQHYWAVGAPQALRAPTWYLRSRLANALPSHSARTQTFCLTPRISSTGI